MMLPRFRAFLLCTALLAGLTLVACDNSTEEASVAPEAGEEEVVAVEAAPPLAQVKDGEGSLAPESPAGDAVTEQEIPHSDVPPPSREAFTDAECDFEEWVGKPLDEAAVKATGRVYRILTPDSMMTMDHSPDRINVVHDKGEVTRVWCG